MIAALLHPKGFVSFPRIPFPETIKLRIRGFFRARMNSCGTCIMKPSVAKHYGCKRARHCGLIANDGCQANRDFSCIRNMNCCFARFAAGCAAISLILGEQRANYRGLRLLQQAQSENIPLKPTNPHTLKDQLE